MAAGISRQENREAAESGCDQFAECDRYIEARIRRTRRHVKAVDLLGALITLAAGGLSYLLLAALFDHWIIWGGMGSATRLAWFVLLFIGAAAYILLRIAPLGFRPVNSLYAADVIEQARPGLKNSLINFLLLRSQSRNMPAYVHEAVKGQAMQALVAARGDAAVDCTSIIRRLLIVAAVVWLISLYALFSPKNPLTSFCRVLAPWADIAAPTRVLIADIQPADGKGCYEHSLEVTARILRLRAGEAAELVYSTTDGQTVRRTARMMRLGDSNQFTAPLPSDGTGLQQDLDYWIEAGDAVSRRFRLRVESAPVIEVEEIEYEYPEYSELPPRRVRGNGDIRALTGTKVTLHARANQPIREAYLDFECDGRADRTMTSRALTAQIMFPMAFDAKTQSPQHRTYQLSFMNYDGVTNPDPVRHNIELIPDLPPEVTIIDPQFDEHQQISLPIGASLRVTMRAADADFKLSTVAFHVSRTSSAVIEEPLLERPLAGRFEREYVLNPRRLGLLAGEEVEFWVAAEDNCQPKANRTETPHYRLRLEAMKANGEALATAKEQDSLRFRAPGRSPAKATTAAHDDIEPNDSPLSAERTADKQLSAGAEQAEPRVQATNSDVDPAKPRHDADIAAIMQSVNDFFDQQQRTKSDRQQRAPPGPAENLNEVEHAAEDAKQRSHPSPTDKMSEGGPQAENLEQGTAGKKQDGIQKTARQSAENQGDDSSTANPREENVGGRSSGGTQGNKSKSDAGNHPGGSIKPDVKKQPRDMKLHDGGQTGESEKRKRSGVDDRPGKKVEPTRGDDPMPPDLALPSTSDASGQHHHGDNSHRRGGMSGEESSRHQPQQQMPDGVSAKGEQRPKNEAASDTPEELKAKLGDDMPKNADGQKPPKPGQGENVFGSGDPNEKENKTAAENFDDYKGGDPYTNDKGDAGAGEQGTNHQGSAPPKDGVSRVRDKKQISPDGKKPSYEDDFESQSQHPNQSDSKGGQKGDETGGGKSGGGQRAENQGTGAAGQNTAASQGGGQSDRQGGGPTGAEGGDRTKANQPAGGKPSGEQGSGSHRQAGNTRRGGADNVNSPPPSSPSGHANEAPLQLRQQNRAEPRTADLKLKPPKKPRSELTQRGPLPQPTAAQPKSSSDESAANQAGQQGGGSASPNGGGAPNPDSPPVASKPTDESEPGGEAANLAYARKAVSLAIRRLEDELAKDQPDQGLLERLDWSRQDLARFIARWRDLEQQANEPGPPGDVARRELDYTFDRLALPQTGVELAGGETREDQARDLQEGRRAPPPAEYAEQWREFNRGISRDRKPSRQPPRSPAKAQ